MFKSLSLRRTLPLLLALAGAAAAGNAQAGGVHWSIGINLPGPPVVYGPPAVVYAPPAPVYYPPRPVRYYSPAPAPVYVYGRGPRGEWCPPQGRHWHGRDGDRWEGRRGYRH